jgi:hypothetical protein
MTELIRRRGPWSEEPPATIDIRRTPSEPIDPGQPSFTTTLPTELRNEVYKWLFHRDEPIIYTGSKSCSTPDFWRDYIQERSMSPQERKEMEEARKKEEELLSTPSHDMGPSIGVLYSNNTFLISYDIHRHNDSMSQLHIEASFLSGWDLSFLSYDTSLSMTTQCARLAASSLNRMTRTISKYYHLYACCGQILRQAVVST